MSGSLSPHGPQHARLPCPSSPRACSNSCPLRQWCHPTMLSSVVSSCLQSFPASGPFPMSQSALHISWPKYWSFSNSPSNEYSGLISFRIDWFDFLAVQEVREAGEKRDLSNLSAERLQSATPSETAPWANGKVVQETEILSCCSGKEGPLRLSLRARSRLPGTTDA